MSEKGFIRFAGWTGIITVICFIVGTGFFFAAGPPQDVTDTGKLVAYYHRSSGLLITAVLFYSVAFTLWLVFTLGVRDLVRGAGTVWVSIANVYYILSVASAVVPLAGSALLVSAIGDAMGKADPSAVRGLAEGGVAAYGAIDYVPLALSFAVFAWAVGRTKVLPGWTALIGWAAAILNAVSIPMAFAGTSTSFYSQFGLGPFLLSFLPILIWSSVVAIQMIRRPTA